MARLKNLISSKLSGNVGAMNFRVRRGETVVAERVYSNASKGEGATESQRVHRSRLANIVNFYRVIAKAQKKAWEAKEQKQSNFNVFSSINLATSPVFLTKQEAKMHASVAAPYIVSRGSLAPISYAYNGNTFATNINVGELALAGATIASISAAIVSNNEGWQLGDKLTVAIISQVTRTISGATVPVAEVKYFELTLDGNDTTELSTLDGYDELGFGIASAQIVFANGASAGYAVHSREGQSYLFTSEQQIAMNPAGSAILTRFSSEAQKQKAMESYGYKPDVLLTPFSEIETVIIEPAYVSGVTLAGQPLADGSTITEGGSLVISGENLSRSNVQVYNGSELYTPLSSSATEQRFTINYPGNYRILINGNVAYTFTADIEVQTGVTSVKIGANTSTTIPYVNNDLSTNNNYAVVIEGADMGALTATGATLSNVGGDATRRTATMHTPSEGMADWTLQIGGVVVAQGRTSF